MNIFWREEFNFDEFWKRVPFVSALAGRRFACRSLCRSSTKSRQTHGSKIRFSWFLGFSLGRCWKSWKNEFLVWEVSQSVKILLPRWVRIKKKNDSHAAWECSNQFLRHLSHENVSSVNGWFFDDVKIVDFWYAKKCVKREGQQDFWFLVRFW